MSQQRHLPWLDLLVGFAVALTCACLCFWKIFEHDVFHYVRLGRELLDFRSIAVEQLSYTIPGLKLVPFQWAAYVLTALIDKLFGVEALSVTRSVFVFLFVFGLSGIVRITTTGEIRSFLNVILPISVFLMCQWRVMLIGDFMTATLFVYLLWFLLSDLQLRKKLIGSYVFLLAWVYLHCGTYPTGAIAVSIFVLSQSTITLGNRILLIALSGGIWFVTPSGLGIFQEFLANTVNYGARTEALADPTIAPFTWELLRFGSRAWSFVLWIIYCAIALVASIFLFKKDRPKIGGPYASPIFSVLFSLMLTAGALEYTRGVLFQAIFILPIVSAMSAKWLSGLPIKYARVALGAMIAFLVFKAVPDNLIRFSGHERGAGVDEAVIPIRAVEFVGENHLAENVLNSVEIGSVMLYAIPNYKVATDGRNLPYIPFLKEWVDAKKANYPAFLDKYKIETVIESVPAGAEAIERDLYPTPTWAPVFIDNTAVVYVRRHPENAEFVQKYEYKNLNEELERCLSDNELNEYCGRQISQSLIQSGKATEAVQILERLLKRAPHNPRIVDEAMKANKAAGNSTRVSELERWASRLR